jgi:hypothetical protein
MRGRLALRIFGVDTRGVRPGITLKTDDLPSEHEHSHGHLKHIRKRRKRSRKLSDNRELLALVIVMVICGLVLTVMTTYLLGTGGCHLPKFLQSK